MNCARYRQVLDASVDGELDPLTVAEIDAHIGACAGCAALRAERRAMSARIRAAAPRFAAPERLRASIDRVLALATAAERRVVTWPRAVSLAAMTAIVGLLAGLWLGRVPVEDPLLEQVVASHVASLAPARKLIDIASSDRHAIKPWFVGRTDFSPLVRDLSGDGLELVGARLDHVGDRQAAVVVYRLRNHYVSLFMWRGDSGRTQPPTATAVRGFGMVSWAAGGVRFAAISDVEGRDLERFAILAAVP
jgi:anti-sigma factor RsiW